MRVPPGGIAPPRRDSDSQVTIYVRRQSGPWESNPPQPICKNGITPR
jgi:hypothetical protein